MPRPAWIAAAVFFTNGLTLSTYIVRIPALKQELHLSNGDLGLTGALFAAAAIAAMQLVGRAGRRWSTAAALKVLLPVMPMTLAGVGNARTFGQFLVLAMLLGAVHGATDTAMNAYALSVEQSLGRPVMNRCHAAWSISAVTASLIAVGLAPLNLRSSWLLTFSGSVLLFLGLLLGPALTAVRPNPGDRAARPRWRRPIVLLGLTGTLLMICEGAALGWGSLLVREAEGAGLGLAALTVTAYTASQTVARLTGDPFSERYGTGPVYRVSALIAGLGLSLIVLAPNAGIALAGFAVMGAGMATLIPLTFSAAGRLGEGSPETVAALTTFTYGGILGGPVVIGSIAQVTGLSWAFGALIPVLLGLSAAHRLQAPDPAATRRAVAAAGRPADAPRQPDAPDGRRRPRPRRR